MQDAACVWAERGGCVEDVMSVRCKLNFLCVFLSVCVSVVGVKRVMVCQGACCNWVLVSLPAQLL